MYSRQTDKPGCKRISKMDSVWLEIAKIDNFAQTYLIY